MSFNRNPRFRSQSNIDSPFFVYKSLAFILLQKLFLLGRQCCFLIVVSALEASKVVFLVNGLFTTSEKKRFFFIGFHIDALGLYRWVYYCGHPVFGFFAGNEEEEGIECMIFLA
jgi:hypothetical protein